MGLFRRCVLCKAVWRGTFFVTCPECGAGSTEATLKDVVRLLEEITHDQEEYADEALVYR